MKPRSIVFDLFGDYVRYTGGQIRLSPLTELLGCFDVGPSTARVAMSRLRNEGWFDTRRDGRETTYALNPRSWRLLDEGRERIFDRATGGWDGQWRMVIYSVPESDRAARDRVRKRLAWLGFGALAPSTWVCPHDRLDRVSRDLAGEQAVRLDLFTCRSRGREADLQTAARCWDLTGLDADYARFLAAHRDDRGGHRSGPAALVERTRLTHDYRLFPFRDPDLPVELLPPDWPSRDAHLAFLEAHELLRAPAQEFFARVVGITPQALNTRASA